MGEEERRRITVGRKERKGARTASKEERIERTKSGASGSPAVSRRCAACTGNHRALAIA